MIPITEKRLVALTAMFIWFAFFVQLKMTEIMCSDYGDKAKNMTVKSVDISTGRADIVDCNLKKITGSENESKAFIRNTKDLQKVFENIREEDREKFYNQVQNETAVVVDLQKPIQSDTIYTVSKRYSSMNIAQHLIGYVDIDGNGVSGIERAYNLQLKDNGEKIKVNFNVNGAGVIYGDINNEVIEAEKVLSLTIDNAMQRICEEVAKENIKNGSIIVMESETGKIKAMVSTPNYDPNNLQNYLNSEHSPMLNKALQSYEPGSVIKPLWAAMLLENGYNKDYNYYCNGYTEVNGHYYHCANNRVHGEINMSDALTKSCNCYFVDSNIKDKGIKLCQMANQMNFGKSIELCDGYYTTKGNFPTSEEIENMGIQSSTCFGQGLFRVSPVHVVSYMNIFANNGMYVNPQVVEGIYNWKNGECEESIYRYNAKQVISKETANEVKNMLVNVVEDGASGRAKPEHLKAGGKTGTAQTGKTDEDGEVFVSWFCGFYPAECPKYTICIQMYDGGESSVNTAPLFKKICNAIYYKEYTEEN